MKTQLANFSNNFLTQVLQTVFTGLFSFALLLHALPASANSFTGFFNDNLNTQLSVQNTLVFVLQGDQTAAFTGTITCTPPNTHVMNTRCISPFTNPQNLGVTFNGTNTLLTMTGNPIAGQGHTVHAGVGLGGVTNGNGHVTEGTNLFTAYWQQNSTQGQIPILNESLTTNTNTGRTEYQMFLLYYTFGATTVQQWVELPFVVGSAPKFQATNSSTTPFQLSNAEYFTSTTQIPLDMLNLVDLPPTDPLFKPIPGLPDGTMLNPGQSFSFNSTPEPATMLLLGTGILGAGRMLRRRKLNERQAS